MYSESKYWPFFVLFIIIIFITFIIDDSLQPQCLEANNNKKNYYFNGRVNSIEESTKNSGAERIGISGAGDKYFYWQEEDLTEIKILPLIQLGDSVFKEEGSSFMKVIKKDAEFKINLLIPCEKAVH